MAPLYLILAVIGAVAPYARFVPWLLQHGLNLRLFVSELFSTRIGGFFGLDVLISAVTLIVFILRLLWLPIGATCLVGVSCGLPLFLYLRERQLASQPVQ
jgi:uncharacterized protein DUF2834